MPNFTAGTSFTDGVTNDVTALKLNALVADAVPTSSLSLNSTTGTIATFNSTTPTFLGAITASTNIINVGSGQIYKDASGNVGVGTTSPSTKLNVVASSNSGISVTNGTMTGIFFNALDTSIAIGTQSNHPVNFYANNSVAATILANGNVGVGNSSPASLLHIENATGEVARFVGNSTANTRTAIGNASGYGYIESKQNNNSAVLPLSLNPSGGNIGVGNTSPSTKLDISASANSGIRVTNGTMSGIFFNSSDTSIVIGTTSNHPLAFFTNNAENLRINSSGDVSIGTATALSKLHVHGDLTMSNATTAVTASAGAIIPPAAVAGYLTVSINGTSRKIPYYET